MINYLTSIAVRIVVELLKNPEVCSRAASILREAINGAFGNLVVEGARDEPLEKTLNDSLRDYLGR